MTFKICVNLLLSDPTSNQPDMFETNSLCMVDKTEGSGMLLRDYAWVLGDPYGFIHPATPLLVQNVQHYRNKGS